MTGKAALGAVSSSVEQRLAEFRSPLAPVLTLTRRAMACDFEVRLNASAEENDTEQALAALDLVEQLEAQLTVYRPDSEVMAINRSAGDEPARVEPRLFSILEWMDRLHTLSAGGYDGTSGPLSKVWGFSRREGRVPTEQELEAALRQVGWSAVSLDPTAETISFTDATREINLNSVGKGYALDRAAELLLAEGIDNFLVQGGRSTLVARGARRQEDGAAGDGWGVGLRHPLRPQQRIAEFWLRDGAFSTSGSGTQSFVHQGKRYGHLLDPRTGWPAEGLHSVSVVAPTGAEADALSTALYVMGPEASERLLADHLHWGALFILPGDSAGAIEWRAINLPAGSWQMAGN